MKNTDKIQLLSPAGSFDALKQAIHNGADEVYLGGTQFGARAYANNFGSNELKEAVNYAHLYGVKIYITANTLIFESEIPKFKEYINFLVSIGADALIIQDIGMADWAINTFSIPIHSSTQMHNHSLGNIEYLKQNGFDRAVLARETEIEDIAKMSEIMETEVFVHGALCICYSGQCLFSAVEHQRSGNRGRCAQACRMKYSLYIDDKPLAENQYLLSPKDLALLEDVEKIIEAGVGSIKIEGRMKSPEYVGFITKTYREIIDNYYNNTKDKISKKQTDTLKRLFNRGFTKGYVFGLDNKKLMTTNRPNHAGVHIGNVVSANKEFITVQLNNTLHQGDGVKFDKIDKGFVCNKIYYKSKLVACADAGQTIQLENKLNLHGKDKLLLTKDVTLLKSLNSYNQKKIPVNIHGEFHIGSPCRLEATDSDSNKAFGTGTVVEQSKNAPLSEENIVQSLSKLGDSPYTAQSITISKDDNIFLSKSNINKLRRDAVGKLNALRTKTIEYSKKDYAQDYSSPLPLPVSVCCTVTNENHLKEVMKHNVDRIYIRDFSLYEKYKASSKNVYYFVNSQSNSTEKYSNEKLVIRDTGGIKHAENNYVIGDYMLNIANSQSLALMHSKGLKSICLSIEPKDADIKKLINNYHNQYNHLPNAEMLIYGHIQLMETKHCMLCDKLECGKCKASSIVLKDIKGGRFPVTTDKKCHNYIYSKEPINKIDRLNYFKSIGINGFRLDFLNESVEKINQILNKISERNM